MQKRRTKRTSRPTDGLVIRHEGSGGGSRWLILVLVPLTMAAAALAYRFYMDKQSLEARLGEVPSIQASRDQLSDALTTERLRGDALEKDLVSQKRENKSLSESLANVRSELSQQPKPSFDANLKPGGLELSTFSVEQEGDSRQYTVRLSVSRMVSAAGLPEPGGRELGHLLIVKEQKPIVGNVRVVVVPEDESNGKRVYLPQKSWRRSEGFQYSLSTGGTAEFDGKVELPEGFKGGNARIEIFVNEASGGYTLLRRVTPWPDN